MPEQRTYKRYLSDFEASLPDDLYDHFRDQKVRIMSEEEYARWVLERRFGDAQQ